MYKNFTKVIEDNIDEDDFTRSSIENFGHQIKLYDRDEKENLDLFCYVDCNNNDTKTVKKCRGLIYNGDKLIMNAFPFTPDYDCKDIQEYKDLIDFDKCSFFDAHEGTLIRVFNFNGKWYTSTHRKFNSWNSKWSGKQTFGKAFEEALEYEEKTNKDFQNLLPASGSSEPEKDTVVNRFYSTLNTEYQYMFLVLSSNDNRIVCASPRNPTVYHVGTFVSGNLVFDKNRDTCIPGPRQHNFTNIDEITDYVRNCDYNSIQGILVFAPNNKQFKIVNTKYFKLYKVRGNEPSIKFRYLQVRNDKEMVDDLKGLYPHMIESFDKYEKNIQTLAKRIHGSYISRFIKKEFTTVSQTQFKIIKDCHSWHLGNREQNRVTQEKVIEVINNQTATHINHMIKELEAERVSLISSYEQVS